VPDILPVCLQDQLRHCKSAVREHKGKQVIAYPENAADLGGISFVKEKKSDSSV